MSTENLIKDGINVLMSECHRASYDKGWWHDPVDGFSLIPKDHEFVEDFEEKNKIVEALFPYVVATKIALIQSEASEMLEAYRSDKMDDKLPEFPGITAEAADVIIRVLDLIGMLRTYNSWDKYDIGDAIIKKMNFNAYRPDHNTAVRRKPGGKKF